MSEEHQLTETQNQNMSDKFARQFANFMRNSFAMNNSPGNHPVSYRIDTQPLNIGIKLSGGGNYPLWAVLMKRAICGQGMESHVTRVPSPPPRTDPSYKQWQQADHCVFTWLIQSLETRLVSRVSQQPTAKHVWDALAVTYASGGDKIQIYDLQVKASIVRQGNNSLEETWGLLQELWSAIDQKQVNPMKCAEDVEIHDRFIQEQRLYQLLIAIDNKYETIKREIVKMNPLPSVEHAYGLICGEESRLMVLQTGNSGGTAPPNDGIGAGLVARGRQNTTGGQSGGSRGGNRSGGAWNRRMEKEDKLKLVCSHCKRKKHTKDSCFKIIGFPGIVKIMRPPLVFPIGGRRNMAGLYRRHARLGTGPDTPQRLSERRRMP